MTQQDLKMTRENSNNMAQQNPQIIQENQNSNMQN